MKITFKKPEEILDFVNKVEKYDCAMDMNRGIYVVDGKSILGIMNLGLNNIINLKIYDEDCEELKKKLLSTQLHKKRSRKKDESIGIKGTL